MAQSEQITRLLAEICAGRDEVESRLIRAVYPELRRIAAYRLKAERVGHTLQATALANEAFIQLRGQMSKEWHSRSHFFAVATLLMRRILVDYARRRKVQVGSAKRIELTEGLSISKSRIDEVLLIDQALTRLAEWGPRQSKVVELRYFGGLTNEEAAEALGISPRTVKRDWQVAKAWLHGELNPTSY